MAIKPKDLKNLKERLMFLRQEITQTLRDSTDEVRRPDESKGFSQHQADEGTDDFDRTISLNLTTREYEMLQSIDRALEKIDEGTYGVCEITGKEIPLTRLEAIPYATTTREAQEMLERGQI
jgi:DnaK suppressor protein